MNLTKKTKVEYFCNTFTVVKQDKLYYTIYHKQPTRISKCQRNKVGE